MGAFTRADVGHKLTAAVTVADREHQTSHPTAKAVDLSRRSSLKI
jgi:hypothetical protein